MLCIASIKPHNEKFFDKHEIHIYIESIVITVTYVI